MATRILVVERELEAVRFITSHAQPLECEVVSFLDSRDAAEFAEREGVEGILVEGQATPLDGCEFAKRVRASRPNSATPLAMIVGAEDVKTFRRGFKAGATCFLQKPLNSQQLSGILKAMQGILMRDRRHSIRLPFRTAVECLTRQEFNRPSHLRSLEISEGGMLLESSGGFSGGQELWLRFAMPAGLKPLELLARVVRTEPTGRIAVDFLALRPQDTTAIQNYLRGPE